jgi:hypothetical protein
MPKQTPDPAKIPEFDRAMRALVAVPKESVEKAEAKRLAKKKTAKPKSR